MSKTYVIINSSEVSSVDFSQVLETSADTLRYNLAGTQAVLKFEGDTPSFLEGKTQYTHSEILDILGGEDWSEPIES
jgi:hypothetical protein